MAKRRFRSDWPNSLVCRAVECVLQVGDKAAGELHDPENITYYFRRVMVIPCSETSGMAFWRKSLFAMMHLNANLPAAYFGVPPAQVVEVGLEVEI